jgi:hypothetical protein
MLHLIFWLRNTKSPEDIFFVTAARNSPFKDTVFIYSNYKYVETNFCCTGSPTSRSTPCSLGVCDMVKYVEASRFMIHPDRIRASVSLFLSRVDTLEDPEVYQYVADMLAKAEKEEDKTGMVKRIPLVRDQSLEPQYAEIPSI